MPQDGHPGPPDVQLLPDDALTMFDLLKRVREVWLDARSSSIE